MLKKEGHKKEDGELFQRAIKLEGRWNATLKDEFGNYKTHVEGHNVVTTNGLEWLASFLHSAATGATYVMNFVAIGTDSTAEAASNTALGTEASRHTGTITYTSGGIVSVVATFAAGSGTGDIVEYGIFDSNSAGTMLNRTTQSAIAKGASDSLEVTANITLA